MYIKAFCRLIFVNYKKISNMYMNIEFDFGLKSSVFEFLN